MCLSYKKCFLCSMYSYNLIQVFICLFPSTSHSFSSHCSDWVNFTALSLNSLILSPALCSLLLSLSTVFFSSIIVFFISVTSISYIFYLVIEVLIVFIYSSFEFSKHCYGHYFDLFIRKLLISVSLRFFSEVWNIFLCFSIFA